MPAGNKLRDWEPVDLGLMEALKEWGVSLNADFDPRRWRRFSTDADA